MGKAWIRAASAAVLMACSGGGSDGDGDGDGNDDIDWFAECDQPFAACGGDVTGSWNVVAVCNAPLTDDDCDGLTWEIIDDRSSGTIEFNGDGTYDQTYQLDLDFEAQLPRDCVFNSPCSTVASLMGDLVDSCEENTEGICDCVGTLVDTTVDSGTWEMDGNTVITDGSYRTEVCVQGDRGESLEDNGTRSIWTR